MVVTIYFAMSKNVFNYVVKMFITHKVQIVENINMSSVENLDESHLRLIKNMNSTCCFSIHANFIWKLSLNFYLWDVRFVYKSDIWLFKAKMLHVKNGFFLGKALFEYIDFSWSETIIIFQNILDFQ